MAENKPAPKKGKRPIEFICDSCGEKPPIDEEMSTDNWEAYRNEPCKCGGRFAPSVTQERKPKETKPTKSKMKPRGGNSPCIGNNGFDLEQGDNARYISAGLQLMSLPPVNLADGEEVAERVRQYFEMCQAADVRPTLSGLSSALGVDRRRLWEIDRDSERIRGDVSSASGDVIKKAYKMLEFMWEQYMYNGKLHPTAGIFFGVNNYGYQNTNDIHMTVEPVNPLGEARSVEAAQQYAKQLESGMPEDE